MSRTTKQSTARVRDYYDGGLIQLNNVVVPSKRVGYKKEGNLLVAAVPLGVPAFEEAIRLNFATPLPKWPLVGRVLVAIAINLPKSEYATKDVDNMAKAILDAFKGIAYGDDKQIDCLYVSKTVAEEWRVLMALKSLGDDPKSWFLEPVLEFEHP